MLLLHPAVHVSIGVAATLWGVRRRRFSQAAREAASGAPSPWASTLSHLDSLAESLGDPSTCGQAAQGQTVSWVCSLLSALPGGSQSSTCVSQAPTAVGDRHQESLARHEEQQQSPHAKLERTSSSTSGLSRSDVRCSASSSSSSSAADWDPDAHAVLERASWVLRALSAPHLGLHGAFLETGCLPRLLALLRCCAGSGSSGSSTVLYALRTLVNLTKSAEAREQVMQQPDAVQLLLHLLAPPPQTSPGCCCCCSPQPPRGGRPTCDRSASASSGDARDYTSAGAAAALPSLALACSQDNPDAVAWQVASSAAWVVAHLAIGPAAQAELVEWGAVELLTELLHVCNSQLALGRSRAHGTSASTCPGACNSTGTGHSAAANVCEVIARSPNRAHGPWVANGDCRAQHHHHLQQQEAGQRSPLSSLSPPASEGSPCSTPPSSPLRTAQKAHTASSDPDPATTTAIAIGGGFGPGAGPGADPGADPGAGPGRGSRRAMMGRCASDPSSSPPESPPPPLLLQRGDSAPTSLPAACMPYDCAVCAAAIRGAAQHAAMALTNLTSTCPAWQHRAVQAGVLQVLEQLLSRQDCPRLSKYAAWLLAHVASPQAAKPAAVGSDGRNVNALLQLLMLQPQQQSQAPPGGGGPAAMQPLDPEWSVVRPYAAMALVNITCGVPSNKETVSHLMDWPALAAIMDTCALRLSSETPEKLATARTSSSRSTGAAARAARQQAAAAAAAAAEDAVELARYCVWLVQHISTHAPAIASPDVSAVVRPLLALLGAPCTVLRLRAVAALGALALHSPTHRAAFAAAGGPTIMVELVRRGVGAPEAYSLVTANALVCLAVAAEGDALAAAQSLRAGIIPALEQLLGWSQQQQQQPPWLLGQVAHTVAAVVRGARGMRPAALSAAVAAGSGHDGGDVAGADVAMPGATGAACGAAAAGDGAGAGVRLATHMLKVLIASDDELASSPEGYEVRAALREALAALGSLPGVTPDDCRAALVAALGELLQGNHIEMTARLYGNDDASGGGGSVRGGVHSNERGRGPA